MPFEVEISAMSPDRFRAVLPADRFAAFEEGVREAHELLDGRVVWNVNSTARGGGVVELLHPLLAYARGAGVDGESRLEIVPGAGRRYEEPGALERVTTLARDWFLRRIG